MITAKIFIDGTGDEHWTYMMIDPMITFKHVDHKDLLKFETYNNGVLLDLKDEDIKVVIRNERTNSTETIIFPVPSQRIEYIIKNL